MEESSLNFMVQRCHLTGELLAYRDLEDALGLFDSVSQYLPVKLIKVGASVSSASSGVTGRPDGKTVRHSGYITFQMVEVSIDNEVVCRDIVSDRPIALLFCLTTLLFELIQWIRVSQMKYFFVFQAYC